MSVQPTTEFKYTNEFGDTVTMLATVPPVTTPIDILRSVGGFLLGCGFGQVSILEGVMDWKEELKDSLSTIEEYVRNNDLD